ncbi:hypothetical protein K8I28_03945 [bacterium]|nr:hypothetical protein [bacterium]
MTDPLPPDEFENRRKITITGGDPFVRTSAQITNRLKKKPDDRSREREDRYAWSEEKQRKLNRMRRSSTVIGLGLGVVALIVYVLVQIASPTLIVAASGKVHGTVFLDGKEIGRTGESIRMLPVGQHLIIIKPDDLTTKVTPESLQVRLDYSLQPTIVNVEFSKVE